MVIGAFVLARLLGLRLLTLEAQVVVHDGGRHTAGPGPLILTRLPPDRPAVSPARPERRVPPGLRDRPAPPGGPGLAGGSGPLARAVQLVEQGADTLERTRRGQYRG